MSNNEINAEYISSIERHAREAYNIDPEIYDNPSIKRGLRNSDGTGVLAGVTGIGSVIGYYMQDGERVPIPGKLYYRGIDVEEIVDAHTESGTFGYEEVAYLLLMGKLPTKEQFELFDTVMSSARNLPQNFFEDMILKAPSKNIMNKLARSVMALYSYDDDPDNTSFYNLIHQSVALIGRFPIIVADAYAVKRHYFDGKSLYIHRPKERLSVAENFLRMLRKDKSYTEDEAHLLDLLLILHAEHGGGNNSAFVCRALSSTGTDTYSAIGGAVGSLKGPLHGGANAKVMEMFNLMKEALGDDPTDDEAGAYLDKLIAGEAGDRSGKIYGLGHAVYTMSDPRAMMLKKYAYTLAEKEGMLPDWRIFERIERLGIPRIMESKHMKMPICANVDLYSGFVYKMLGIPPELYTPLFAIARIAGWCAHRIEEVLTCNRIIRPAYRAAVTHTAYVPMEQR